MGTAISIESEAILETLWTIILCLHLTLMQPMIRSKKQKRLSIIETKTYIQIIVLGSFS